MATFTDRIRFVVEAVTGQAEQNLRGLRTEITRAEGATGKLKAGFAGLSSNVKAGLGAGAAAVGAGLVAFGTDAVQTFLDTATAAKRLADTTGLTTEEASRWLSVLRPLNVEGADLADILGNINSKAAEGRLEELGINAEDSHERLQQTIEFLGGIADETKRAQIAAELLGEEGTRQLAPLVASAGTLRDTLAEVSDAQAIDEGDLAKAEKLKDTIKELDSTLLDVKLNLGEWLTDLAPTLTTITGALTDVKGFLDAIPGPLGDVVRGFGRAGPIGAIVGGASGVIDEFRDRGPQSNATMAPPGTPGISTPTVHINNFNYGGTDPKEVERASRDYWSRNGSANTSGRP